MADDTSQAVPSSSGATSRSRIKCPLNRRFVVGDLVVTDEFQEFSGADTKKILAAAEYQRVELVVDPVKS